jgi:hypothetical protein
VSVNGCDVVIAEDGDVEMRSEMMRTVLYLIVHVGGSFFQSLIDHVNKDTNPTRDSFEGNRSHETRGSSPLKHISQITKALAQIKRTSHTTQRGTVSGIHSTPGRSFHHYSLSVRSGSLSSNTGRQDSCCAGCVDSSGREDARTSRVSGVFLSNSVGAEVSPVCLSSCSSS